MSPFGPSFLPQPAVYSQPFDFLGPLFSYSYKSLFPQLLSIHIHTKPPGVWGISVWLFTSHRSRVTTHVLSLACSLFVVSLRSFLHSFPLFSRACSLFCQNTRGGGACDLSRHSFTQSVLCEGPLLLSATTGNARAVLPVGRRRKALRGER